MINLKLKKVTLLNQSYIDVRKISSLWPQPEHVSSSCEVYILSTTPHCVLRVCVCVFKFEFFQFSSVTQSCPTLCKPMNHSMPGLPVHHKLLESTQTHVHRVSDAIQPSQPLPSPSPPAPNPSQHQGLFQ